LVPQTIGHLQEIRRRRHADVVDENLYRAETFSISSRRFSSCGLWVTSQVSGEYISAQIACLRGDFFKRGCRSAGDDHPAFLSGKGQGDRFADAASRTGHQNNLCHRTPSSFNRR
jgi:hypothetical protein